MGWMDRLASLDSVVAALTPDAPAAVGLPLFADQRRVSETIDAISF